MPTELALAFARKRAAKYMQIETMMLLFGLIVMVGLVFEFLGSSS
jgi:hypothetical protein